MKSILTGVLVAALFAIATAYVLEGRVQENADQAFHTEGVRL